MPSLDRAYGFRGALIALMMAAVAGGVHGVIGAAFDIVVVKILIGFAGAIVLIMAGAISARRWWVSTIALGLSMGALFFVTRWTGWGLMEGGFGLAGAFWTVAPLGWPEFLAARDVSGFWVVEAISLTVPALFGCYVGHERAE